MLLYLAHCAALPQLSRRFLAWVFAGLRCGVSRDPRTRRRDGISFRLSCVHAAQTVQTGGDGRLKHERCLASPSALQLGSSAREFQGSKLGNPLTPCSTTACLCFVRHPAPPREKKRSPRTSTCTPTLTRLMLPQPMMIWAPHSRVTKIVFRIQIAYLKSPEIRRVRCGKGSDLSSVPVMNYEFT